MGTRLLLAFATVVLFSNLAFAGPQIVISDPTCDTNLNSGNYSFVYSGQDSMTFCNNTSDSYLSLNFTISSTTPFDLSGFYCGSPQDTTTAAFDYCLVLDPTKPNQGQNNLLYGNANPQELVVHQFVTSYILPPFPPHDTPNSFYQNNRCFFGCPTNAVGNNRSSTVVAHDTGNEVHLSFNLFTPLGIRPDDCDELPASVPCGLLPGHSFTITFKCDSANTDTNNPCIELPDGAGVSFQASTNPDQVNFPTPVPEPTTLLLVATAGIPAFLRRRKKM